MNRTIITAIGIDKPGLVDEISSIISQHNGNIENSKMIKIDNQFAMIIDFSCLKNIDVIKNNLNEIIELDITYKTIQNSDTSNNQNKKYLIKGVDDQGIVNGISNFFSNNNINIVEINTFLESAPITGSPLFNMEVIINYNKSNDICEIDSRLKKLCEDLNLDIKIL